MVPYLKYYVRSTENDPANEFRISTKEEWETLRGYEPTKICADYDQFVIQQTEAFERKKQQGVYSFDICRISVGENQDIITETEQLPDFVRWV